jgi:hypothetical protein
MSILKAGTIVDVEITGNDHVLSVSNWTGVPLDTRVSAALQNNGLGGLQVLTLHVDVPTWLSSAGLTALVTDTYPYTLRAQLMPTTDYAQASDLASILYSAVWGVTGLQPSTESIVAIGGVSTGQPVQGPPQTTVDLGQSVGNVGTFLAGLTSHLGLIVGGLVVVAIVVALVIYKPRLT